MNNYTSNNTDNAIIKNDQVYNKPTTAVPKPEVNIGIDLKNTFFDNIVNAGTSGHLDTAAIQSFTQVSQSRDTVYRLLDSMCEDTTVSSILETYAEDATEYNDEGRIVWAEASDKDCLSFVTFLLDSLRIDKHIYSWTNSLCKYGDLYLRLYRQSDLDKAQSLFKPEGDKSKLNEDIKIKAFSDDDHYVDYIEMERNPAEVFELTKFGKTEGFIKAKVSSTNTFNSSNNALNQYQYRFNRQDIELYDAKSFVHATLEDNSSRVPEVVDIFIADSDSDTDASLYSYTVRRGQSLFYNQFKIWRELTLLENSLLLNRITKSAIVRMINVEVGDMPKEMVGPHLEGIKQLIEQKIALKQDNSLNEYTNPGPMENNIYVPTHEGKGAISSTQVGGDVDVGQLYDIEYYRDKFFGGARVPKQYFGFTDDGAGFNGGASLSIISSRYAKMIKRIQNTLIQAVTDLVNLYLIDKKLDRYVNKFTIKMLPPTTQEEIDRRESKVARIGMIQDIMNLLNDIETPAAKLKVLKALLSTAISDEEVIQLLQSEIEKLEEPETPPADDADDISADTSDSFSDDEPLDFDDTLANDLGLSPEPSADEGAEEIESSGGADQIEALPNPEDLGIDFTDNSGEF